MDGAILDGKLFAEALRWQTHTRISGFCQLAKDETRSLFRMEICDGDRHRSSLDNAAGVKIRREEFFEITSFARRL